MPFGNYSFSLAANAKEPTNISLISIANTDNNPPDIDTLSLIAQQPNSLMKLIVTDAFNTDTETAVTEPVAAPRPSMLAAKVCLLVGGSLVSIGMLLFFASPLGAAITLGIALVGLLVFAIGTVAMCNQFTAQEMCAHCTSIASAIGIVLIGALGGVSVFFPAPTPSY